MVALILTLIALSNLPVSESVRSTALILRDYGLIFGGFIIGSINFIGVVVSPVALLVLRNNLDSEGGFMVKLSFFLELVTEVYVVYFFFMGFLEMTSDIFLITSILTESHRNLLFSASEINTIASYISMLSFFLFLSFRIWKKKYLFAVES